MLLGNRDKLSGRGRNSSLERSAARSQDMVERRLVTALTSRGLSVREAMDRRCVRLSLAC